MKTNPHNFSSDVEGATSSCTRCGIERFADQNDLRFNRCRPTWHETWMNIARTVAERSYDPRLRVGAIIVSEDNTRLLSLGYNGNHRGGPNIVDSHEPGQSGMIHAEVNCIIKCDYNFNRKKIMYLTHSPCVQCAKIIVNANISEVIYDVEYRDPSGIKLLESAGVSIKRYSEVIITA